MKEDNISYCIIPIIREDTFMSYLCLPHRFSNVHQRISNGSLMPFTINFAFWKIGNIQTWWRLNEISFRYLHSLHQEFHQIFFCKKAFIAFHSGPDPLETFFVKMVKNVQKWSGYSKFHKNQLVKFFLGLSQV